MIEIWLDIKGYEGLYQVSNFGRVKSLGNDKSRKERILKPDKDRGGYLLVHLSKEGKDKNFRVHRLVATAFLPNQLNLAEVNHKDEDKTNNCVDNLEWCDRKYNCNYGTYKEKQAKAHINHPSLSKMCICLETNITYHSAREAERQTWINNSNIAQCCKGKRKTAGGFHWKYVD